jgi:CspA family cold shock protein
MDEEKKKMTGVVKFFKGTWGFIVVELDGEEEDVFVYQGDIITEDGTYKILTEGEHVEFEIRQRPKGLQAFNVKRIE